MRELFEEEIESEALKDTLIYKKYIEIVDYGKENKYFKIMYKLNDEFCVSIKEHIYLYHLVPMIEINNDMILPCNYVDSKMYIGDTWWQDDEEILGDLKKLSIIDFIKKYKAY
ncbi:hypothetical protein [Clostridium oceanicum]|uniref:Uncharacterized protein n=1 Tax=Clostridium oceanicum TaxID=1543 RepID=A0ABN1JKP0_9CLOT